MLRSYSVPQTISHFKIHRDWYIVNEDYQREEVWSDKEKQYLIDSIVRKLPIPQIFVRVKSDIELEIVDGQQRLTSIWQFIDNEFPLSSNYSENSLAGKKYEDLPREIQVDFDNYSISNVMLENYDDEAIRRLFRRLQSGKPLSTGEKLNAFPGTITLIMRELAKHPLFNKIPFSLQRYRGFQLVGILFILTKEGIKDIGAPKIYDFFDNNKNANSSSKFYKDAKRVLNYMNRIIKETTFPELSKPAWFVNFFLFTKELLQNTVIKGKEKQIYDFYKDFFQLIEDSRYATGPIEPEIVRFYDANKSGTTSKKNIMERFKLMIGRFLEIYPSIELKDDTRGFSEYQRIAIYRRDKGICQNPICSSKVSWKDYHADHKIPHSSGGKTIVSNGQVLCTSCNLAKQGNPKIGY